MKFARTKNSLYPVSFFAASLLLVACGGGGSGGVGVSTSFGTKQMGVTGKNTSGNATATDASGNVYLAGASHGGLNGNTLTGTTDLFLTKYDAAGNSLYTKQMGVAGTDAAAYSVATDTSGNVYVAGETYGGLDGNVMTGTRDLFLVKYNATGNKVYTKQMGVIGDVAVAHSVATDKNGNVYVAGYTYGGLDGNTLTGTADLFLVKYNSAGVKLYTKQIGVLGKWIIGRSVATDTSGNIYVSGNTNAGLDGNTLTGWDDFFLIKYDVNGVRVYTKQMGVANNISYGYSVAVDANGNAYVTGRAVPNGGTAFLAKYDANGTLSYNQPIGFGNTGGESVAVDTSNNVYVVGGTDVGLDGNTLTGTNDFFITKLDSSGGWIYTKQMGVPSKGTYAASVATDASGNVYVAGSTTGGLDGNILIGTEDCFLVKFDSVGNKK